MKTENIQLPLFFGERRSDVAALYVSAIGPYPAILTDWFDHKRDARTFAGGKPVVCHPPCGPWGRLSFLCKHQDPSCALHAVDVVRACGGVLEHPTQSRLWKACGLPLPGAELDRFGGRTYEVRQVAWGHCCVKPTWLYVVRIAHDLVLSGIKSGGFPTRRVFYDAHSVQLPTATKAARTLTPEPFARWLVSLAAEARPKSAAARMEAS